MAPPPSSFIRNVLAAVCVVLGALHSVSGALIETGGTCPTPSVVQNFNVSGFLGPWYEYSRSAPLFELAGICPRVQYAQRPGNQGNLEGIYIITQNGKETRLSASAEPADRSKKEGSYIAHIEALSLYLFGQLTVTVPFKVLDADYVNYAIVYSCLSSGLTHSEGVVVLTRAKTVSADVQKKIDAALKQKVGNLSVSKTRQDCKAS